MRSPAQRVRNGAAVAIACAVWLAPGCDFDGAKPGAQLECSSATGRPLGCDQPPIDNAEDACAKLLECGQLPVENPDGFDFADCIDFVNSLEDFRYEFVLTCVEVSSCDELVNSDTPCFEHGEE